MAMVDLAPVKAQGERMERLAHQGGDLESHGLVDVMSDIRARPARKSISEPM